MSFFVIIISFLLGLSSCTKLEESSSKHKKDVKPRPLMKFEDTTTLMFYDGNNLVWKMKTRYLERWEGTERIFAKPVHAQVYDSIGKQSASLIADSASLDTRLTFVKAYGNVHATSPGGAGVRADSLIWDKKTDRIYTESPVRVVSEDGDVLTGDGFDSDASLKNWRIHRNIIAIFQDASPRMKHADSESQKSVKVRKK